MFDCRYVSFCLAVNIGGGYATRRIKNMPIANEATSNKRSDASMSYCFGMAANMLCHAAICSSGFIWHKELMPGISGQWEASTPIGPIPEPIAVMLAMERARNSTSATETKTVRYLPLANIIVGIIHKNKAMPRVGVNAKTLYEAVEQVADLDPELEVAWNKIPKDVFKLLRDPANYVGIAQEKVWQICETAEDFLKLA